MKNYGSDYVRCFIRKNLSKVVIVFADPDSNSENDRVSSTNSVVIHLVHGDKVDLGGCTSAASIFSDTAYETTFSGFLLKAD